MSTLAEFRQALTEAQTAVDRAKVAEQNATAQATKAYDALAAALEQPVGRPEYIVNGIRYTSRQQLVSAQRSAYDQAMAQRRTATETLKTAETERDQAKQALTEAETAEQRAKTARAQQQTQQGGRHDSAGDIAINAAAARQETGLVQNPPLGVETQEAPINPNVTNAVDPFEGFPGEVPAPIPSTVGSQAPSSTQSGGPVANSRAVRSSNLATDSVQLQSNLNFVYKAISVTCHFRAGRFTQDLEGLLLTFPNGNASAASNSASSNQRTSTTGTGSASQSPRGSDSSNAPQGAVPNQGTRVEAPNVNTQNSTRGTQQNAAPSASGAATLGPQRNNPPTSGSQPVNLQPRQSAPSIQVFLKTGGVVNVDNVSTIQSLFDQGKITAQERSLAIQGLQIKQRAAQNTTSTPPPKVARDP